MAKSLMRLILFFTLWGCSKPPVETPLILVGQQTVFSQEFRQRLLEKSQHLEPIRLQEDGVLQNLKSQLVQELLLESFLLEWASTDNNLTIAEAAIEDQYAAVHDQYVHRKAFFGTLNAMKVAPSSLKKRIQAQLIKKKLLERFPASPKINEKGIESAYWKDTKGFREPSKVKIQQILVSTELEATTLQQALKASTADFDQLAKTYSISPEAENGGHIGWIAKGVLPAFDAAFKSSKNKVLPPQKSTYGYHIVKVVDKRRSRRQTLDEVKTLMRQKSVSDQKIKLYGQWLEAQLLKFRVKINEQAIASAQITVQRKKL